MIVSGLYNHFQFHVLFRLHLYDVADEKLKESEMSFRGLTYLGNIKHFHPRRTKNNGAPSIPFHFRIPSVSISRTNKSSLHRILKEMKSFHFLVEIVMVPSAKHEIIIVLLPPSCMILQFICTSSIRVG